MSASFGEDILYISLNIFWPIKWQKINVSFGPGSMSYPYHQLEPQRKTSSTFETIKQAWLNWLAYAWIEYLN